MSELISNIADRLLGFDPAVVLVAGMAISGVMAGRWAVDILKAVFNVFSLAGTVPEVCEMKF